MNTNDVAGSCAECGKLVRLLKGSGRTREYVRGVPLPIPDDFLIPTCTSCGETYITEDVSSKLDPILKKQYLKLQSEHFRRLTNILMRRHGITQREIVRVCGITPSYLSHVLAGKRQASTTLTRLLEAFVDSRSEFERHLKGQPWSPIGIRPFAVVAVSEWAIRGSWTSPSIATAASYEESAA